MPFKPPGGYHHLPEICLVEDDNILDERKDPYQLSADSDIIKNQKGNPEGLPA